MGYCIEVDGVTYADHADYTRLTGQTRLPCPVCGEAAVAVNVGVTLIERTKGEMYTTARADPGAPPRFECPEGHYYVVVANEAVACGPPCEVTVVHEPRGLR